MKSWTTNKWIEHFHEAWKIAKENINYDLRLSRENELRIYRDYYKTNYLQIYYRQLLYFSILEFVDENFKFRFSKKTLEEHNVFKYIPSF